MGDDSWNRIALMQTARQSHSSCALASGIYVFAGIDPFNASTYDSVEFLAFNPSQLSFADQDWTMVNIASDKFVRRSPISIPFNAREIMVMGGTPRCRDDVINRNTLAYNTED